MSLLDDLKGHIDAHQVISFDIFDTLLLRPYVKPTDLFFHLEHIEKIWWFRDKRIKAEQFARQLHLEKEEITLDDIYNELEEPFYSLKSKELELERQILYPNPEMKEVFNYVKKCNKKIIITSDMYLPKNFLKKVLKEKGFYGYHKFYLSSEINKTKGNGSLYKYILSDLNIPASEILHIGDNEQSDVFMAKKYKISAYHYLKAIDKLFQNNLRATQFYKMNGDKLGASILLGVMAIFNLQLSKNYWQDFGFQYGGPVVYGYMQWLNQQLEKDHIKEIMFVARDGYTLQKVFDIVRTSDFKSHYYYAPRILNLACNLNYKLNMDMSEKAGLIALRSLLSYFKNKNKFLAENTPEITTCAEGDSFIKKHWNLYYNLSLKEQKSYQNYLKSFCIQEKKVALVDTCSVMLSAQKSLIIGLPNKEIKGYYWFTWKGGQKDISQYKTATFQESHSQEFLDWNIMEFYMTAPTPPADYIENGKVIFKKINSYEQQRIEVYPDLSEGIVSYAKFVNNLFGKRDLFMTDRILIDWTNVLCQIPTVRDRIHFKKIQHAWDTEHTKYIPLPALWFNHVLQSLEIDYKFKWILLFNCIPLIKKEIKGRTKKSYLFNKILLLKEKRKLNVKSFLLFGFISLFQIRYSENVNSEYPNVSVILFNFIPFINIRKEINIFGKEKTKIYLGKIRLMTFKRSKI